MSDQPPVPPVPPVPATDPFGRLLRSIPGRDWLAAVIAAIGGWVAAYVVAGLSLLLTVAVAAAGGSGSSTGSIGSTGPLSGSGLGGAAPDVQDLLSGVSVLLGAPAQLVALADLGRLHLSGSAALFGVSGSAVLGVVPAVVLAAQVVIAVVLTRRIRTRELGLVQLVVTAVLSGVVLAAVTTLTGLVLAIRFPDVPGVSIDPVHAVGLGSVLGSFVIGTLSALLARPSGLVRGNVTLARALGTARIAASQLGVLVVVLVLVTIVVALIARPEWGAAIPLLVGNLAMAFTAFGFLGGIGTSDLGSGGSTTSAFGGPGAWVWLVVLFVLVTAFAAGLALAVRRNDRARTTLDWVVTPLVWLLGGVVVFVLGTGVIAYQATGTGVVGGSGSVGVTPWTPLVFALWGGAVEAVARYVAPGLLPRVGGRTVLVAARLVGTDPRPAAPVPAWSAAPGVVPGAPAAPSGPAATPGAPAWGQAAGAQSFPGSGTPAPAPMSPRAKKVLVRSLIAGGAVVVVVIAGAVTTSVLRSNVWGPAPTVRSYVDAIARGDAAGAERLSEVPPDASMLDSTVLKSAADRPKDVRVGRVTTSGDSALATVTYTQGGKNRSGQVTLRRTGTTFLVKDEWRVTRPLADTVSVTASDALEGAPVTVGGKKVGEISDGAFRSLAYPGTYDVRVGGSKYFTGGTKTVSVGGATSSYVDFQPKATKQLTIDAEAYVTDLIESCAAKTDVDALSGCPWYSPYDADGPVEYQVKTMPKLTVDVSGSGTISVESTEDGVIGYDYTSFFGDSGHAEDDFDVYEYLEVQDGTLVSAY
ncbi:hypothetical protein FHW23_002901 [Curtobacterium pusillum]|uniref:PEGA domain-containing protein n=1 Tax=Curtobacterium pusillum TaxID=69373 RepID=A0AAW3TCB5_9MICO|nr:hypothetical protein [Curtobacterium pusillum]MBA8991623.1 hypothetical protein [Curtobacterium pusillum]